jgi:ABC-type polysaccharide/polyol phosphate transport system ATPase subunit
MSDIRIDLRDVSVRFRMSYDQAKSLPEILVQTGKRIVGSWTPRYHTALDGVTLQARTGDVIGVLGPNGAGKSTLLRTISGIYHPDAGTVSVDGRVSALLQLGTGFNNALPGRDNIILGGLTLGFSLTEIKERMGMILEFADIGDFIDVPMRYYSSGMIARLSFAMVVSMEPDILLIDETLSVGDLSFQKKSQAAMRKLLAKASCQFIVSHSLPTIEALCTRAIYVSGGRILADGTPKDVIAEYASSAGVKASDQPASATDLVKW